MYCLMKSEDENQGRIIASEIELQFESSTTSNFIYEPIENYFVALFCLFEFLIYKDDFEKNNGRICNSNEALVIQKKKKKKKKGSV